MTEICSSLNGKSNASPDHDSCLSAEAGVTYADIEMKERYFNLKKKNKDIKILNHMSSTDVTYDTGFDSLSYPSMPISSIQHPSRYNTLSSQCKFDGEKSDEKDSKHIKVATDISKRYNRFSKRLKRYRYEHRENYYLTYPGEIFSKHNKRHKSLPTVSSTQSCNHLYMFKPIIQNSKGC